MDSNEQVTECRRLLTEWAAKQGHESCHYYPEIFRELARVLKVEIPHPHLPTIGEFHQGCQRYQNDVFEIEQRIRQRVQVWCEENGVTGIVERRTEIPTFRIMIDRPTVRYNEEFADKITQFDCDLFREFDKEGVYLEVMS